MPPSPKPSSSKTPLVVAGVVLAVIAAIVILSRSGTDDAQRLRLSEERLAAADYDGARAALRDAASSDAKLALMNRIDARKEKAATALAELRNTVAHVRDLGLESARAILERLKTDAPDEPTRLAVESALRELAMPPPPRLPPSSEPAPAPKWEPVETSRPRRVVDEAPPADGLKAKPESRPLSQLDRATRSAIDEANRDAQKGRYRSALETLAMAGAEAKPEVRERLDAEAAVHRDAAARALRYLLEQADELEKRNRADEALALLHERRDDFPDDVAQPLRARLESLGGIAAAAPPASEPAPREDGDAVARDAAPRIAACVARLAAAVSRDATALRDLDLGRGRRGAAVSGDAHTLTLDVAGARESIPWSDLPAPALKAVAARAGPLASGERLGLALLFEGARANADADRVLKEAVDADATLQPAVNAILARRRGIEEPSYGFVWHRDRWMTFRERETDALAERIRQGLGKLASAKTPADRARITAEIEELGGGAADAMILALGAKRDELWNEVRSTGFPSQLAALEPERARLDAARAKARELIFDEKKYFYPYKSPECPSEKAKLYPAVQEEVDHRVDAIRDVWKSKASVPLGAVRGPLATLLEVDARLTALAGTRPAEADLERVLAVDASAHDVTLATYARDRKERRQLLAHNQRIALFNAAASASLTPEERRCLALTNEYRALFGLRALATNERLVKAARKHSEWMAQSKTFSHFSDLPGLRSPFERMRAEGYKLGASENIALSLGPDMALLGWIGSSGHHRNLLGASHTELGIGASGSYWTQDFGHGDEYRTHASWKE